MKIITLKLANAIKCGPKEETFLTGKDFDMELRNGMVISITHIQSKQSTNTTLFNTIYWMEEKPAEKAEEGGPVRAKAGK